jgi:hypothetical protein
MFKKSAKSEMVTGRLVDSFKKPLLSENYNFDFECRQMSFIANVFRKKNHIALNYLSQKKSCLKCVVIGLTVI